MGMKRAKLVSGGAAAVLAAAFVIYTVARCRGG
jgi:hypothetical protein